MSNTLIEVSGLRKSFGGVEALASLDLSLAAGEICGIMGPNGSGKTVLFDLISGHLKPDAGQITFDQTNLVPLPPHTRHALGITRTYQYIRLFGSMSVGENAMVGIGPKPILQSLAEVASFSKRRRSEELLMQRAESVLGLFE